MVCSYRYIHVSVHFKPSNVVGRFQQLCDMASDVVLDLGDMLRSASLFDILYLDLLSCICETISV